MGKYGKARQATDHNSKIRRMRTVRWITTATETHSEYLTLFAFPQQQRLHEHASLLRYMYTACLVNARSVSPTPPSPCFSEKAPLTR